LAIDGQRPLSSRSKRRSGLKIAGGMSMTEAVDQRRAIEWINDAIGEPFRLLQGIDNSLARKALAAGCVFALDSDAHTTEQLAYAETALAHARLANIPVDRIVNCWPLDRLLAWISNPSAFSFGVE
jgi:hypothetical protein